MTSRDLGPGDVVHDATEGSQYAVEEIKTRDGKQVIVLYDGEGEVTLQDGKLVYDFRPDHDIELKRAPGRVSMADLMRPPERQYLLLIEREGDQEDEWITWKDGNITFNSKEEAVEYFQSFGRQVLELGAEPSRPLSDINEALYEVWSTQLYSNPRPAGDITTSLLYYGSKLQESKDAEMESDDGMIVFRVRLVESSNVSTLQ